ncbi:hypothetical protein DFR67_10548 [Williamsia limnetica]|uniref:Uncharacterized protein n=1 Tax=Williamsia limnetica TaxID=882452 RepID=A0A318RWV9_WILLI|nr:MULTISPECIES: hypothetical protein [Williamsia]PYE17903.1 hypothetical protein DFR67_10548 [Williamsia limnetica]
MPYSNIERVDEAELIALADDRDSDTYGGTLTVTSLPGTTIIPVSIIVTKA